ncbi:MAG: xanthine dehydrogenase family protein molybdopterin-binding subunit [Syntrophobacteraceae bacterium]|jgi:isoquinoline 1-oxidoreductase beta subunit
MSEIVNFSRRDFLKAGSIVCGGLVLGFYLSQRISPETAEAAEPPFDPNAFLRIDTDGTVTVIVNKSEMGQGVYTSLPMLVAEELECDWSKVRAEPAPVNPVYVNPLFGIQMTGGSMSVKTEWERMRKVGAAAREMLIGAAAKTWKVKKTSCRAQNGRVIHSSGKALTYGQLTEKAARMPVPKKVSLKGPSAFKILGKPWLRLDTPEKVNGRAIFGYDVVKPGMLTALVARPPVFGGKVKSFDVSRAKAVPGVRDVVQVASGVAVVADNFWAAKRGRDALQVDWDEGRPASLSTKALREQFAALAQSHGSIARKDGDPEKALASVSKQVSADYEVPYLAHATMEPLNCVVDLRSDGCDIWTGTQFQTVDRGNAARIAGLAPEKVRIFTTLLGGGFGRRANPHSDFVVMAVEVARAVKQPVKVVWTREDDMKGGYYRPMWHSRLTAGLDSNGTPTVWNHTLVGQSIMTGSPFEKAMIKDGIDPTSVEGAMDLPYEITNMLVSLHSPRIGVPVQWWRSVGHSHTAFVVESFIDELAHEAGKDPYQFRRAMLANHPRHRGVLDLAAQKAGWGTALPAGQARGIAVHKSFDSFVSEVAEVSVGPTGEVSVHKVVCAIDCGMAVNPSIIESQAESAIVFGLSAALYGAITLKDGRVEQSNFHDYKVLRMDRMPAVEVHIVQSNEAPSGIGEPGTPPIAPAVANAIFSATGKRIRRLPISMISEQ